MQIFHSDRFLPPLPEGHRFPMEKYALLRERVGASEKRLSGGLKVPPAATVEDLTRVHDAAYVRRVLTGTLSTGEVRRIGFPWSPELAERSLRSAGGTLCAARAALSDGVAVNLSGGTHHAFPDRGEGYCLFNDVAVAAKTLLDEDGLGRVAILDLDVHQGNGTAFIFRDDPNVFTLSVHGESNYPFRKEPSDLDLGLPDNTGDRSFLMAVKEGIRKTLGNHGFDLAFYLAGADPYQGDRLGRLAVSKEALAERDRRVLSACRDSGIPVAVVMAGGYASDIRHTVDIHYATVRIAAEMEKDGTRGLAINPANV